MNLGAKQAIVDFSTQRRTMPLERVRRRQSEKTFATSASVRDERLYRCRQGRETRSCKVEPGSAWHEIRAEFPRDRRIATYLQPPGADASCK